MVEVQPLHAAHRSQEPWCFQIFEVFVPKVPLEIRLGNADPAPCRNPATHENSLMDIVVAFKDRSPSEHLAWTARRALAAALDRFAARIRDVTVRIRDENGAKGGIDQHCSVAVRVVGGQELHLHDIDATAEPALHRLARRAARLVRDRFARQRSPRR
jgi:hypothetical protein